MTAPLFEWRTAPLSPDVAAAVARLRNAADVAQVALMPDVHLAHDVCIGTVLATHGRLYPAAIGGDVGCGVATLGFEGDANRLTPAMAGVVLRDLSRLIPALLQAPGEDAPLPGDLEARALSTASLESLRRRTGRREFGTLGRGNHFVELQVDDDGRPWAMVHSGSRAMGPAIQAHHQSAAARASPTAGAESAFVSLVAESEAGRRYLADLDWAIDYARASRERMLQALCVVLSHRLGFEPRLETHVDCGHNHVRREAHGGRALWVHRKGAISAAEGERGLIPGSMGDMTCHVTGRGHPDALGSASHGAGRQMSRTEARSRVSTRDLHRQMHGVYFDEALAHALRDEAPGVYRPLSAVMRAQADLVRIERRVRPLLSYKGASTVT
jgi:tRNA-splicing ligase RtcB